MRYIPIIIVWIMCAVFAMVLLHHKPPAHSPLVGREMPSLTLPSLEDDAMVDLASLTQGKMTLVNFFASWCIPCQKEHETLLKLHKQNVIPMVGIAWKNKQAEANTWLAKAGVPYDVALYDIKGISTVPFGLTGVPETFVVSAEGKILYHTNTMLNDEIIAKHIMPLLRGKQ